MTQFRLRNSLKSGAAVAAVGLAVALVAAPAVVRAQEDGSNENALTRFERKVWNGFVRGLGLKGDEPPIDYRERSPLVVPPTRDLPPPQANARPRNPAWPVDPDVKRAKENAEARKKRATGWVEDEQRSRPLTPDELNPSGARTPTTTGSTTTATNAPDARPGDRLLPSELGYFGGLFSWSGFGFGVNKTPEVGTFTKEPPRSDLTAPPAGYQTPSAAQPYGFTPRIERSVATPHDPAGQP